MENATLARACLERRADVVLHLAAAVGVNLIVERPLESLATNIRGSEIVLEKCHKYGRKVPPYRETQAYVRKIVSVTEVRVGPRKVIYKIVELVDGREVPRYSDTRPQAAYEVVTKR